MCAVPCSDGSVQLAMATSSGTLCVWDPWASREQWQGIDHDGAINAMCVLPDDREFIVTASQDRTVRVCSSNGALLTVIQLHHEGRLRPRRRVV
ncbi:hypothetical protein [Actinomadura sp. 9N215]|uniref:hypothetical protein n=1 Tax=Actinomadura sp. 9N215 TaxID=3375150 RepID=UPI003787302C